MKGFGASFPPQEHAKKEAALREKLANEEETRRKVIAKNEAAHLEQEAWTIWWTICRPVVCWVGWVYR